MKVYYLCQGTTKHNYYVCYIRQIKNWPSLTQGLTLVYTCNTNPNLNGYVSVRHWPWVVHTPVKPLNLILILYWMKICACIFCTVMKDNIHSTVNDYLTHLVHMSPMSSCTPSPHTPEHTSRGSCPPSLHGSCIRIDLCPNN